MLYYLFFTFWFAHGNFINATETCDTFINNCEFNASLDSCTFTTSTTFSCNTNWYNSNTSSNSYDGSDGDSKQTNISSFPTITFTDTKFDESESLDCRWEFAGDIIIQKDVVLEILGDDCSLVIVTGQTFLMEKSAQLIGSSIQISAATVQLDANASISASYNGTYRGRKGMFPGTTDYGASYGGSGGQRINVTTTNPKNAAGSVLSYFDVRSNDPYYFKQASAAWDLEALWEEFDAGSNGTLLLGSASNTVNSTSNATLAVKAGGRIRILASKDVIMMKNSSIRTDGESAINGLSGGSGGSVFLKTLAFAVNGAYITARGGNVYCRDIVLSMNDCFPGGGGGRIHVTYTSSGLTPSALSARGGHLSSSTSGSWIKFTFAQWKSLIGAAGTVLQVARHSDGTTNADLSITNSGPWLEETIDSAPLWGATTTLNILKPNPPEIRSNVTVINNTQAMGTNATTIHITSTIATTNSVELNSVSVSGHAIMATREAWAPNAVLAIVNNSQLVCEADIETKKNDSQVASVMQLNIGELMVFNSGSILTANSDVLIEASTASIDHTSTMQFGSSMSMRISGDVHVGGNISTSLIPTNPNSQFNKSFSLISGGTTVITGKISAGLVRIQSKNSLSVVSPIILAANLANPNSRFDFCEHQQFRNDTPTNYTLVLHSDTSIIVGKLNGHSLLSSSSGSGSPSNLQFPNVIIRGAAILICSPGTVIVGQNAEISTSGMGALANQGPGAGGCVASFGGGGGYGGRGGDSSPVTVAGDYAAGGLPYGTRAGDLGMIGSGGGCVGGGSSGGVLRLRASALILNGGVHCNGYGGYMNAGGGSGGFLEIAVTQYLKGRGSISAVGGGSQCISTNLSAATTKKMAMSKAALNSKTNSTSTRMCGGGGGGGRLELRGCDSLALGSCTDGFFGNYTVAGGSTTTDLSGSQVIDTGSTESDNSTLLTGSGSSGSFFGFPCVPGYGGLFCRMCEVGTFKSESNSEDCLPCRNAPSNAHYSRPGAVSSDCPWVCNPGYSGSRCVSPLQQLLDACGGEFGFAIVLVSIVVFFTALGYACRSRKEHVWRPGKKMGNPRPRGETDALLHGPPSKRRRIMDLFCRCFYWPRVQYPKLLATELNEHMARIYLLGTNDSHSPWQIRTTVPPSLENVLFAGEYAKLAERINRALAWKNGLCSSWGEVLYMISLLICGPYAVEVTDYRRHLRLNALKKIIRTYNHACMKGPRARGLTNALKLGYAADYSLVYLELLYKEFQQSISVPTTKIGKPGLPLTLLFAGRGTFYSPLYLDPSDLLVRSVPQCPELTAFIDDPWIEFVAELNELLRVVQMNEVTLLETLLPVAKFLEKKMTLSSTGGGKLGGLRIFLGRFYVGDDVTSTDALQSFKLGLYLTTVEENRTHRAVTLPRSRVEMLGYDQTSGLYSGRNTSLSLEDQNSRSVYMNSSSIFPSEAQKSELPSWVSPNLRQSRNRPKSQQISFAGRPSVKDVINSRRGSFNVNEPLAAVSLYGSTQLPDEEPSQPALSIREEALRDSTGDLTKLPLGSSPFRIKGGDRDSFMTSLGQGSTQLSTYPQETVAPSNARYMLPPRNGIGTAALNNRIKSSKTKNNLSWTGPVDMSYPVPGVLISSEELIARLSVSSTRQKFWKFVYFHILPRNVARPAWIHASWILTGSLLVLLILDLAITTAIVVNLKCVTDGQVDPNCTASILMPVLLLPPLALLISPIVGIVSLALASTDFSRKFAVWNSLSMINVLVTIINCYLKSSRLVAPWFTDPLPLLPAIAFAIKAGEAHIIKRYIAFEETDRRRRGWRGLMKRRASTSP